MKNLKKQSGKLGRRKISMSLLLFIASSAPAMGLLTFPITRSLTNARTLRYNGCGKWPSIKQTQADMIVSTDQTRVQAKTDLPDFRSKEKYTEYLKDQAALPQGFSCGSASGTFIPVEAPMMGPLPIEATVISLDEPTDSWAACFTKNKFPGAPIHVGRNRMACGTPLQALVINNKVSNVCSGGDGVADSELVCEAVASGLKLPLGAISVMPSSTGVIGWNLPAKVLADEIVPAAVRNMQSDSILDSAKAIMTTDRYPKLRCCTISCGARIVGIAKGAGMIEPNMATMLSYILTDAAVGKDTLKSMLTKIVDESFNSISVDGAESTSDTVACLASSKIPLSSSSDIQEFESALTTICKGLASDIVRNGEGTSHVLRVTIENFPGSNHDARLLGRHIVNSPLFKCAVAGNDPNTGRLAGAIGSFLGRLESVGNSEGSSAELAITLGGRKIFAEGKFILGGDEVERDLSNHMREAQFGESDGFPRHQKFVEIGVDFGAGGGAGFATVLGSDLTKEYVSINADYRS